MKKIYKIIVSISVFLIVLFVGVVLVIGNTNKKANAGVVISSSYAKISDRSINKSQLSGVYISLDYAEFGSSKYMYYLCDANTLGSSNAYFYLLFSGLRGDTGEPLIRIAMGLTTKGRDAGLTSFSATWISCDKMEDRNNSIFLGVSVLETLQKVSNVNQTNADFLANNDFDLDRTTSSSNSFFRRANTIENCTNIYDLENKSFCLIYLSDISGIATAQMRDEITMNWGFINENDNALYSEYAPTISAQNLQVDDDTIIRLGVPLNNSGSTMNYYDISQKAILSTIDSSQGGATATAHIYGIYIWRNLNMIEWGLAEFDTTSTPTSGASMNYLTSTTRLYQYQNIDTTTMTCRLSVSSNFNFITIKNQEQVSVSSVNTVIRQGGFMPAWSLYNWARGSHSGFTSGEQYGSAPYQQGQPGYDAIFQAGRQAGLNENIGTQQWFMKIFQGVDSFLNIRIFPNITFGVLLGIPFVISVVWFIIRSFRGGGGD